MDIVKGLFRPLAAVALLLPIAAAGQAAEPFGTRNLSPPAAIFALPDWRPVPARASFAASLEVANHYRLSRRGTDGLLLDGETTRLKLRYEQPFGADWSFAVELPFIEQHGGWLDDAVDGWHSVFGLPDGGRNGRPEDELEFRMTGSAGQPFALTARDRGIGDVVLSVGKAFGRDAGFTVRGSVKVANGDESLLAGSGSTDWMLTVLRTRAVQLRRRSAGFFWGGGIVRLGSARHVPFAAEDAAVTGLVGGGIAVAPRLGFKAQVEVHTPFYDSPLEEIGQTAVQVSLGGWWSFSASGRLDIAVGEDLHVSTAPDVLLHAALRWHW